MLPPTSVTTLGSFLLLSSLVAAVNLECGRIQVDKKKFDLSKLGGPHSILVQDTQRHPSLSNTTWTIDICQNLKKPKDTPENPKEDQCPNYTRVCGITKSWNPVDDPNVEHPITEKVIPVAGDFHLSHGGYLDPQYTRLKSSDAQEDGLSIELNGGRFDGRKQRAVISFICDKAMTGNEGYDTRQALVVRRQITDGDEDEQPRYVQDPNSALQWKSYDTVEGKELIDVLYLNWRTKYACEEVPLDDDDNDNGGGKKSSSWGFFTWFILILFLLIAAYLIFGSWLNYNRYGARGWDLLPHGDTIRDVPYLFKDWSRKVVDTVTGHGGRGGYSAV